MPSDRNKARLKNQGKQTGTESRKAPLGGQYEESLLMVKRKQYLAYRYLREVCTIDIVSDQRMREIRNTLAYLQRKWIALAQMLPYSDLCSDLTMSISPDDYPSEIEEMALQILDKRNGNRPTIFPLTDW